MCSTVLAPLIHRLAIGTVAILWLGVLVLLTSSALIGVSTTNLPVKTILMSFLYVHCKSGRDRSAITLYAFLRLQFGLTANSAWASLQFRVGRDHWPVARVWDQHDILAWIDDILNK